MTAAAGETPEGDEQHRQISDLKGDLAGYKSEEDPDYHPESGDSLESTDESTDEEGEVEEVETKEAHEEVKSKEVEEVETKEAHEEVESKEVEEVESEEAHEEAEEVQEETVLKK